MSSEYVVKLTNGTVVECASADAVRKLVGKIPGMIAKAGPGSAGASGTPAVKKQKTRKRTFRNPGLGPKKSWSMGAFHAVVTGQSKDDARRELSKLRQSDRRAYLDKEEAHEQFIAWYAKKAKIASPGDAMAALQAMFDDQYDDYAALVKEFSKKKPAAPRRAG